MDKTTYEPIGEDLNASATKGDLHILAGEINERFDSLSTKEDFSLLLNSVDKLVGQVQTYNAERSAETHRLERIENWIRKAADVTGIPTGF